MLSRSDPLLKLSTALAISILLFSSFGTAFAQIPGFEQEWPVPPPPPGYSTWYAVAMAAGYRATGPISVGGVPFFTKVLDRSLQERDPFTFNDQPFYAEVTVPAGVAVAWIMGIVEYHPPSYMIRYLLAGFPLYIGTAGSTSNVGPFPRGNADPEGKYAWRVGMMALVCDAYGCRWYWSQSVQYYNFVQTPTPPTPTPDFTITAQNPPPVSAGDSTTASVQVNVNPGWKGDSITLTASAAGVQVTLSPPTLAGTGSSTLSIQVPKDASPGPYTITVLATGAGLSKQATCTLIVKMPPPVCPTCPFGTECDPATYSCITSAWVWTLPVVVLVVIGIVAVFLLTRRKPPPAAAAYKPFPAAPQPVTLKPGAPQAVKPVAHVPRVVARREEEKK